MYACPPIDVLYLTWLGDSSDSASRALIANHLRGKVVAYTGNQCAQGSVRCDLAVKAHSGTAYNLCAVFGVTSPTVIVGLCSTELVVISSNRDPHSSNLFGAIIRESTHIVWSKTCAYGSVSSAGGMKDLNGRLFEALTPELQATLTGCARQCWKAGGTGKEGAYVPKVASLMLVGQSGSGCASAVRALALRTGALLTAVRVEQLYEAAEVGKRSLTREWGRRAMVRRMLQGLVSSRPCILLLEDLHFLARRTGAEADRPPRSEAEDGVVEGLVHVLASMRQLSGTEASCTSPPRHLHAGLLIVGCTYEDGLLDKALLEAFEERVHFPLPTALQRRSLCAAAWWAAVPPAGEATPRPLPAELNQFSDSMAGVPLIPLLLRIEQFMGQLVPQETSASHTCSFEGVAGLEDVKRALSETVLWPRRFPHLYRSFLKTGAARGSIDLPTGLLLFGPPGTGKTLLPRALSEELGCALVVMRLSEVVRGEVGTSERRVRGLFQEAKQTAPSIVFIDEFQAIFTSRGESNGADGGKGEVGSTLSAALAGCFDDLASWNRSAGPESIVTVIAATNEPWAVDGSFLRPGRLGKCLLVGPLDTGGRAAYVRRYVGARLVARGGIAESVAQRTEGFSGADLSLLCARASRTCAEGSAGGASLSLRDFEQALQCTAASTSAEDMEEYRHWQAQYPHLCGAPDTS